MDTCINKAAVQVTSEGASIVSQTSGWHTSISSFHELSAEQCKVSLDSLRASIIASCGSGQEIQASAGQHDSCEALLAALIRLAQTWLARTRTPATQDSTRTVTSALRCIIAVLSHGPSSLLQRDPKRVHELSLLCISVFQWLVPAGPGLRNQASTSSLSQLRRPGSRTSNALQQTGALAFGGTSVRQSRPREANHSERAGSHSRSSSASSWRSVTTAQPSIPSLPTDPSGTAQSASSPMLLPRSLGVGRTGPSKSPTSASELESEESATESRMESGKPRSSSSGDASRACKYYCIACLSQINTKNAKAVFQDWPLLFGQPRGGLTSRSVSNVLDMTRPDQALSVRTAAIHLCEAALEQAGREGLLIVIDDRPQRSSAFISLAARTGAVVSDIRLCIASILTLASTSSSLSEGSSSLTLAALKAAKALITSTPNVAYRQRSADILTPPVVSLCSSLDSSTAATAFSVLSELMGASTGNNAAIQAMPVDGILAQLLQSEPHLATVRTQAWKALSSVFEQSVQDTNLHSRQVLELCHQTLKQSPSDLERQAAISMLPLLLRREARQIWVFADQSEVFQTVTSLGVKDVNTLVRCSAADCVLPLAASSDVPIHRRPAHELLERLLSDSEAAVCAAAARAIGVCFDTGEAVAALQLEKTDDKDSNITAFIAFATGSRLLRTGRCDEEDARKHPSGGPLHARAMIVKMRASWSFATMCDKSADQVANAPASATRPLLTELLRLAIALSKDDDRVAANGLRALGALLRASPSSIDMESYQDLRQTQDSGFAVVIDLLQKAKDPKIRWNAGAALERAFSNVGLLEQICSQKTGAMTIQRLYDDIVGAACGDKMYKVKLASLQALVRIHSSAEQLGGLTNDTVCTLLQEQRPRLRAAKDDLEERAETAPFKERQLHVDPCRKALEALLLRGSKANDDSLRDR